VQSILVLVPRTVDHDEYSWGFCVIMPMLTSWSGKQSAASILGAFLLAAALGLTECTSTTIQGYADRNLPSKEVQHLAAYVAAPAPLASSMQASIAEEARRRGILVEDALNILPPTRADTDADVRRILAERGVDGVLLMNVADSGVISQYAGTIFNSYYSGTASLNGTATNLGGGMSAVSLSGTSTGSGFGTATPIHQFSRKTDFTARLIEPASGRNLWVGNGEVSTEGGRGLIGRLTVTDSASASHAISAIFDDLQKKGLIGRGS